MAAGDARARPRSTLDRRTIRWLVLWGLTVWLAVAGPLDGAETFGVSATPAGLD